MKHRDISLFTVPLVFTALIILAAWLLFGHISRFESSYRTQAIRDIKIETKLLTQIISPMLENNLLEEAQQYIQKFSDEHLRITLIDSNGNVLADTSEPNEILDNHLDRPEIQDALQKNPKVNFRYSSSLNQYLIYYAESFQTHHPQRTWILRVAVVGQEIEKIIIIARQNILFALLFGAALVALLILYIIFRIRTPLVKLQESANRIACGDLEAQIPIPSAGIIKELAITIRNMKEQLKEQIDQVRAEKNERELLFNSMSEAVLLVGSDGEVVSRNKAAENLFSIPSSTSQFNINRGGSPELIRLIHKAFSENSTIEQEIEIPSSLIEKHLFIKGRLLEKEGRTWLLLAIADLTNLRKLESFRIDFIANVSHEIKTPLSSILSAVESLEDGALSKPEISARFLQILSQQAKRLNFLVQDILSLAALERRQVSDEKCLLPTQIDSVILSAINLCSEQATKASIELKLIQNESLLVRCDPDLLEQAIVNLISNAIRYSGSPTIEIALSRQSSQALISVRDYGIGISGEHIPRIFERFYRVHKERSRQLGGTGLGLAIVKHIVQLHGGTVTLESTPRQGCLFKILLPLYQP